ncbi:MAG: YraN family protein [Candidatus Wolfebacteria bacterium]|nr:YraN family protein [Candidatus Wolfebacteria bacterium]
MTQKLELGNYGETLACEYLIGKGYKILERNYRKPWGELDIVARAPDKTLIFVEVKTMTVSNHNDDNDYDNMKPEDQMSRQKILKTQKAAQLYAGHYPEKIDEKRGWRIDLIALTTNGKNYEIKHYENI